MRCNCATGKVVRKSAIARSGRTFRRMSRRPLPRNVIWLSLVSLFTDASSEMIYPLVPVFLATVLGAGAMTVGAIEGTAESVASLLKFGSGWWSDRMPGRKPLVVAGYAIASLLRPLIGIAQSASHVFAIRVGDRIGKGIRTSPRDALIADAVSPDERGRAFGFHRSADHLGAVIGPLIAFLLLRWVGISMRGVFLLAAIPAALAMLVLVLMVREEPRRVEPMTARRPEELPVCMEQELEPERAGDSASKKKTCVRCWDYSRSWANRGKILKHAWTCRHSNRA